jgi:hypothetical protein
LVQGRRRAQFLVGKGPGIGQWPPRRLKGPGLRWMEALPGTLGGQG